MKGRITKKLEQVLRDKNARGELGQVLSRGEDGRVQVGTKVYTVKVQRGESTNPLTRPGNNGRG